MKASDDLLFKLFSGKDYDKYVFGTDWDNKMTGDRIAAEIMNLEKETFGHTLYKIIDTRLFVKPGETRNVNDEIYASWDEVCLQPPKPCLNLDINIDNNGIWLLTLCNNIWTGFNFGTGNGGSGSGGGSGSSEGGSGSGGGSGPNGSGGSSSGNGGNNTGLGWQNVRNQDSFPNNRCKVVDSLMKTHNFPLYYKMLRDSVTTNHEKGFFYRSI